jgi:hypothetical protein
LSIERAIPVNAANGDEMVRGGDEAQSLLVRANDTVTKSNEV